MANSAQIARALRWAQLGEDPWGALNLAPNPTQGLAVKDESRHVLLSGGKGAAKSTTSGVRCLHLLSRERGMAANIIRQSEPDLMTSSMENLAWLLWRLVDPEIEEKEVSVSMIEKLPADLCEWRREPGQSRVLYLYFPLSNSRLYPRHMKDAGGYSGTQRGFIWIDEADELAEDIYQEADRRARQKGVANQVWLSTNPPRVPNHWIERTFAPPSGEEESTHYMVDQWTSVYQVSARENERHLPEGYLESLEGKPEQEKRWLIDGKLGAVFGLGPRVFPEFHRGLHVCRDLRPFEGRPIQRGWDIGAVGKWLAAGACSLSARGHLRVLMEWEAVGMGITDFAMMVQNDCNFLFGPGRLYRDDGDPNSLTTKSWTDGRSALDCLAAAGVNCGFGSRSTTERRETIARYMTTITDGVCAFQIDARCRKMIAAFDGGLNHDNPKSSYAHLIDQLAYSLTGSGAVIPRAAVRREPRRPSYNFRGVETEPRSFMRTPRVRQGERTDGYGRAIY